MRGGIRAARPALFGVAGLLLAAGVAAEQVVYLSLLDDKNLAGTATLTTGQAGLLERERPLNLERKQ